MLDAKQKQIGAHVYLVRGFGATQQYKVLTRILKIVGPALGGGLAGMKTLADDGPAGLGKAISELFERATPEELDSLIKEFAANTEVDGKPLKSIFDLHFSGKLVEMGQWLLFAAEVNYADFFAAWKGLGAVLAAAVGSRLKSPSTSSGLSGGSSSNGSQP